MISRKKPATPATVKADEARRVTVGRRFSLVEAIEYPDGARHQSIDSDLHATRAQMRARSVRVLEAECVPVAALLAQAPGGSMLRDYVLNNLDRPADSAVGLAARIVELCCTLDTIEETGAAPMREVIRLAMLLGRLDALARVYRVTEETSAPVLRMGSEARRKYTDEDRKRWTARWNELRAVNSRMSFSDAAARIAAAFGHGKSAERTIREHLATLQK